MIRTHVRLTDMQAHALDRAAAVRGMTRAALIRELLEQALSSPQFARSTRARSAIDRFASGTRTASRQHDRELDRLAED